MNSKITNMVLPLNEDIARSYTLSSDYYLNPAIYEQEKEKIFYKTWQYVSHISALSEIGDYVTLKICDQNIFVIREVQGDNGLRGFYNVCKHRAHELLQGMGNAKRAIVCPYHAWTYNIDGSLRAARMSGQRPDFDKCQFSLSKVRVELFCGFIFVNLDENAISLNVQAADMADDIRARLPYINNLQFCGVDQFGETNAEASWKVVVDNFLECYHCTSAHPDFASVIDMQAYQVEVFDIWSRQCGPKINLENTAYPLTLDSGYQGSAFWFLWPNTTFNVMPGSDELSVYAVRPTNLESCNFEGHTFTTTGKLNMPRAKYTADVLVPEDMRLCESVQRGLKSKGYDQGPFIYDAQKQGVSEHALHHFHRMVYDALN